MEGLATDYFVGGRLFADRRLDRRLGVTFEAMARRPEGTLPKKLPGRGPLVGGYRMFNHPEVTHRAILEAHRDRCLQTLAGHRGKTLLLHDTTVLDYSGLGSVEGLGQVGDGHGRGLYAHHSLLLIPGPGRVVGLLHQALHVREAAPEGETRAQRRARPGRESRLWKDAVASLPATPEGADVTDVSDRGSDITEYIAYEQQAQRAFIVRSQHNRKLAEEGAKLHDLLRALPLQGRDALRVRTASGDWREAQVGLAWRRVRLLPPRQARGDHGSEPLVVWAVAAREVDAPAGVSPLEWFLLTSREVESVEQAREVVGDYACRWVIEEYHKALKSGCGVELLQMTTRHGLDNAIALLSVLAVHLLRLRDRSRDEATRDQPACEHEDPLLVQLAARSVASSGGASGGSSGRRASGGGGVDWRSMTLWQYTVAVAKLGGYVLNPRKHPPGWQTLWRGYTRLHDMREGLRLMGERCVQT